MANSSAPGHTEETRKRMSLSHKGVKHTRESRERISKSKKGWTPSEETLKNMSASHKGCTPWNKGIPVSDEHKKYLSDKLKGTPSRIKGTKVYNDGKRDYYLMPGDPRISELNLTLGGKPRSEEHKRRISMALKGKPKIKKNADE